MRRTLPRLTPNLHYHSIRAFQSGKFGLTHETSRVLLPKLGPTAKRALSSNTKMEQPNGHVRHKRKGSPVDTMDRPTKQLHRSRRSGTINSDHSEGQYPYDVTSDLIDPPITATADTAEWQDTIERVVRNVVSIHFCQTCSFDTSAALSSEATGFVVDKEKGYILTNRHVVGSGPFWGYCIFDNHEEVCKNCSEHATSNCANSFIESVMSTLSIGTLYTTSASSASIQRRSNTCPFRSCNCGQTLPKLETRSE